MREMKNSGIEWIGEIPIDWNIVRMKSCIAQRDSGAWGEEQTGEDDIVCLRIADFDYSAFKFNNTPIEELTYRHYPKETIKKLALKKNDILIEKSGGGEKTPVGRTVIFDKSYQALFANFMDRLRVSDFMIPEFMQYVFVTFYKNNYTRNYIKQTTGIQNLDLTTMLANENIPLPSMREQKRIADFLERKCLEIDTVIKKTKTTIEEYKSLKQSIITDAVTKGVRGNRPTKDSGIEWVGKIPAEWDIKVAFQLFKQVKNKNEGLVEKNLLSLSYGKIIRKSIDAIGGLLPDSFEGYNIIEKNDIVLRLTDLQNDHTSLRVGQSPERGIVTSAYVTLRNQSDNTPLYLYYYLHSFDIFKGFYGMGAGVRQGLNWDGLKLLKIIIPSVDEQKEITDYLDKKCAEIDNLIAKKTALLEEMEQYKKSVIYEYVTGKKECTSEIKSTSTNMIYPYFPAVLNTNKPRFAQAVLMSRVLDKCQKGMGRVKLEKMMFTIENSVGFDFETEYVREAAGPLDGSIYECETIISRNNKWFYINESKYGVSYKPTQNKTKYVQYYNKYFADYDNEIEHIIDVFKDYTTDQAEIVATLFGVWNDFIIDQKQFTDEDIVDEVLNNWNDSKKRFPKDVWLRALSEMRNKNIIPKGYGKHTIIKLEKGDL